MLANKYGEYNTTSLARNTAQEQREVYTKPQKKTTSSYDWSKRVVLLMVTVALFAFVMVVRSHSLTVAGNQLVALRQQEAEYIKQNDLLRLEAGKLKSPERINTIAKNVLGMTIAKQNIYINKDVKE